MEDEETIPVDRGKESAMTLRQRLVYEAREGKALDRPMSYNEIAKALGISKQGAMKVYRQASAHVQNGSTGASATVGRR